MACRLPSLSLRKGFLAGSNLFSLSSSGLRRRRFGIFWIAVAHGLGTNPAAVLLFRRRSLAPFCSVCLVACRLPSLSLRKGFLAGSNLFSLSSSGLRRRTFGSFWIAVSHGLGTNPAAVLLFRRRSPSTFLLGLSGGLQATKSFVAHRFPCWEQSFFSFF